MNERTENQQITSYAYRKPGAPPLAALAPVPAPAPAPPPSWMRRNAWGLIDLTISAFFAAPSLGEEAAKVWLWVCALPWW